MQLSIDYYTYYYYYDMTYTSVGLLLQFFFFVFARRRNALHTAYDTTSLTHGQRDIETGTNVRDE